jgi:hypothetical protein
MYTGYTSTTAQDRARWELMQRNAQKRAQAGTAKPRPMSNSDRLYMALAIKKMTTV